MFQTLISVAELQAQRKADWVVVDCRFQLADTDYGRNAFSESHIAGAYYAHLDDDLSGTIVPGVTGRHPLPETEAICSLLGSWGVKAKSQVVIYDDGPGAIASRLWWQLRYLGHTQVAVLNGGFTAWVASSGVVSSAPAGQGFGPSYPGVPRPDMIVEAGQLLDEGYTVVDARARERYRGETEPIDPVAGHIPGSISRPFRENIGKDGKLIDAAALGRRFGTLGDAKDVVQYCGSGVTAAYNLLAMEVAGLRGARMYPGSWSEWITDPRRPVETG